MTTLPAGAEPCRGCGHPVRSETAFCPNCGMRTPHPREYRRQVRRAGLQILALTFGLMALGILLGWVWTASGPLWKQILGVLLGAQGGLVAGVLTGIGMVLFRRWAALRQPVPTTYQALLRTCEEMLQRLDRLERELRRLLAASSAEPQRQTRLEEQLALIADLRQAYEARRRDVEEARTAEALLMTTGDPAAREEFLRLRDSLNDLEEQTQRLTCEIQAEEEVEELLAERS